MGYCNSKADDNKCLEDNDKLDDMNDKQVCNHRNRNHRNSNHRNRFPKNMDHLPRCNLN